MTWAVILSGFTPCIRWQFIGASTFNCTVYETGSLLEGGGFIPYTVCVFVFEQGPLCSVALLYPGAAYKWEGLVKLNETGSNLIFSLSFFLFFFQIFGKDNA